jgi:hypothetical protein
VRGPPVAAGVRQQRRDHHRARAATTLIDKAQPSSDSERPHGS